QKNAAVRSSRWFKLIICHSGECSAFTSSGSLWLIVSSHGLPPFVQTRRSNMSFRLLVGAYQFIGPMIVHAPARPSHAYVSRPHISSGSFLLCFSQQLHGHTHSAIEVETHALQLWVRARP